MTDRSSEERSRTWTPLVEVIRREMLARFSDKLSMEEIASCAYAVAALEDRQEATPLSDEDLEGSSKVRMCLKCGATKGMRRCPECGYYADPGVPSEATPNKENAPKFTNRRGKPCSQACYEGRHAECTETYVTCNCTFRGEHTTTHAYANFAAPAPEVQGTPTKSNITHQPWCASVPRPMDRPMGRGPYKCNCGAVEAAPAPVGTPQKETPPSISAESSSPLQLAEEKTVPEGVQGTPTEICEDDEDLEIKKCAFETDHAEVEGTGFCRCTHVMFDESAEPVGTPQKETPPMPPQSSCKKCGLQMARITVGMVYRCLNCEPLPFPPKETPPDAVKMRIAQYKARIPCGNCGHVHLGSCSRCDPPGCEQIVPPTAPVPEGVQGKEPQTFEEYWKIGRPDIRHLSSIQQIKLAEVRSAFSAGGAAGRRSAITEMKEWAETWESGICVTDTRKISAKCTELQEKK